MVLWILLLLITFRLRGFHPLWLLFPEDSARLLSNVCSPNPDMHARRFGLFRFRSPLLPKSHVVFSSSGYLDVSVHRVPFLKLCIYLRMTGGFPAGFPHSDICGSMCICHSPQLFAAYHVFRRLLVPRHPPCALLRFTSISIALLIGCLSCCVHNFSWFLLVLKLTASDVSIFRIFAKIDISSVLY